MSLAQGSRSRPKESVHLINDDSPFVQPTTGKLHYGRSEDLYTPKNLGFRLFRLTTPDTTTPTTHKGRRGPGDTGRGPPAEGRLVPLKLRVN